MLAFYQYFLHALHTNVFGQQNLYPPQTPGIARYNLAGRTMYTRTMIIETIWYLLCFQETPILAVNKISSLCNEWNYDSFASKGSDNFRESSNNNTRIRNCVYHWVIARRILYGYVGYPFHGYLNENHVFMGSNLSEPIMLIDLASAVVIWFEGLRPVLEGFVRTVRQIPRSNALRVWLLVSDAPSCTGTTNPDRSVLITIITWHF